MCVVQCKLKRLNSRLDLATGSGESDADTCVVVVVVVVVSDYASVMVCCQIYCNGMSYSHPKEYITLAAGDSDNYSEVYDKR